VYAADTDKADWNRSAGIGAPIEAPHFDNVARLTSEVFVTIRYGIPRRASSPIARADPSTGFSARTMTAVEVEQQRADTGEGSGRVGHGAMLAVGRRILGAEVPMGLLDGKQALVFGVANDHSIAWGIARAFHEQGATLGFSSVESLIDRRVKPLAESIGATFVEPCDVQDDAQIAAVFEKWGKEHGDIDILVHALAFAKREDLDGHFIDTSRDGFTLALDVSAYSLVALARAARPPPPTRLQHPDAHRTTDPRRSLRTTT
jgi:hypothetical protein